jgi:hypothetical protein
MLHKSAILISGQVWKWKQTSVTNRRKKDKDGFATLGVDDGEGPKEL